MAYFEWYPKYRNVYQSWNDDGRNHHNYSHMSGRVIIHIGENSYPGSFVVGHTHVTVRFDGREITISKKLGRFTKHIDNRIVYYNAYFDEDSIKSNTKTTGNPTEPKNEKNLPEPPSPTEGRNIWNTVFGNDPKYWKKLYQKELDTRWVRFDSSIENLTKEWEGFKKISMEISEAEKNAEIIREEWAESLKSLGNLINKKTIHEKGMWDTTQNNRQNRGVKIKQKFIRAGVDEMNFNSMADYIKQYPELQSSDIINRAVDNVKEKRDEVVNAEKAYREKIKEVNVYLNITKGKLQDIEHRLTAFETFKTIGETKMKEELSKLTFKIRSVFWSVEEKENLKLFEFEFDRKIEESRDRLKLLKEDLQEYEKREFAPIVTKKFKDIED